MAEVDTEHGRGGGLGWRRLIAEFITVALGVVVGLAGDQWKETRNHQQLAAVALDGIRQEIVANNGIVEQRLAYHKRLQDSVNAVMNRTLTRTPNGLAMRAGAHLPTPEEMGFNNSFGALLNTRSTAWQTILSTNVLSYLDYATIRALTDAYATQDELKQEMESLAQQMPTAVDAYFLGERQVHAQLMVLLSLNDVVLREGETLCAYDRLMRKIGPPQNWKYHECRK